MGEHVLVTGVASFADVFKAVPRSKETPNEYIFKCNVLVKKGDPQVQVIQNIINNERKAGLETPCFKDGATDDYFAKDPIHHNYMIFSASCADHRRPHVVDTNLQPIIDKSKFTAGMWCSLSANIHSYIKGKGGVRAGLEGVKAEGTDIILDLIAPQRSAQEMFSQAILPNQVTYQPPGAAPAPVGPPITPAPVSQAPQRAMTATATATYEQYVALGWNDEQLIASGFMEIRLPTTPYAWS